MLRNRSKEIAFRAAPGICDTATKRLQHVGSGDMITNETISRFCDLDIRCELKTSVMESRPAIAVSQVSADPSTGESLPDGRNGCPWHDVLALLRQVKLRPTRQRMALGWLLFAKGDRHLTAEMLYEEANRAKIAVSLATVYNTLHQFTDAGLLREVAVNGSKTYFDTNVSDHHHFFIESEHNLVDIPDADSIVGELPPVPEGYEISRVDVVVRLKPKKR
jgi:Fur family transcriptional regulator, iron response regulator